MWVETGFHLDKSFMAELAERPVPWGGGLLSRATFYRTYSRNNEETNHQQEHWHNVVQRCVEGVFDIRRSWYGLIGRAWPEYDMQLLAQAMAEYMFHMRFLPPGRGLYAMGTHQVRSRGNAALNNCAFVQVGSRPGDLGHAANWMTQHLMLGVGVGFRIPEGGIGTLLRKPFGNTRVFVVPDSREGWAESVEALIETYDRDYGYSVPNTIQFDYSEVRPVGSPIKTFGGIASGPAPLIAAHEQIRALLDQACDDHGFVDTELVADVMNILGVCVIAGNVRRSAEIAVGSPDDSTFIHMKDIGHEERQSDGTKLWIPGEYAHRAGHSYMSNNSVWLDSDQDFERIPELVWHIVGNEGRGEPGFINARNIRTRGRYRDKVGNGNLWLHEDHATGMDPAEKYRSNPTNSAIWSNCSLPAVRIMVSGWKRCIWLRGMPRPYHCSPATTRTPTQSWPVTAESVFLSPGWPIGSIPPHSASYTAGSMMATIWFGAPMQNWLVRLEFHLPSGLPPSSPLGRYLFCRGCLRVYTTLSRTASSAGSPSSKTHPLPIISSGPTSPTNRS